MGPLQYLIALRRRWKPIVALTIVAAVVGLLTAPQRNDEGFTPEVTFTATHTLLREAVDDMNSPVSLPRLQLFATTGEVPERVVQKLGLTDPPAVVASEVEVSGDEELGTITITAYDPDPDKAAAIADGFAEEVVSYFEERMEADRQAQMRRLTEQAEEQEAKVRDLDRELRGLKEESIDYLVVQSERDAAVQQYGLLSQQLSSLVAQGPASLGYLTLQEAAPLPMATGGIHAPDERAPRAAVAGILGFAMAAGLALAFERFDTRVRSRRGAETAFALPVVCEVPPLARRLARQREIITLVEPASPGAEAYRLLRLSLQMMPRWVLRQDHPSASNESAVSRVHERFEGDDAPRVILVTASGANQGKSTTVANLAASYAEGGKSVLLLDCDFRGGDLHHHLGVSRSAGLRELLEHDIDADRLASVVQPTKIDGVGIVCSGGEEMSSGDVLRVADDLIAAATSLADVVLIDAGPMLAVNDPAALAARADAVVVVSRAGKTTLEAAQLTSDMLARVSARVAGVVLVGVAPAFRSAASRSPYGHSRPRRGHGEKSRPIGQIFSGGDRA